LARLKTDGTLDTTFVDPSPNFSILSLAVQPDAAEVSRRLLHAQAMEASR
jgi:hypothetical protein